MTCEACGNCFDGEGVLCADCLSKRVTGHPSFSSATELDLQVSKINKRLWKLNLALRAMALFHLFIGAQTLLALACLGKAKAMGLEASIPREGYTFTPTAGVISLALGLGLWFRSTIAAIAAFVLALYGFVDMGEIRRDAFLAYFGVEEFKRQVESLLIQMGVLIIPLYCAAKYQELKLQKARMLERYLPEPKNSIGVSST